MPQCDERQCKSAAEHARPESLEQPEHQALLVRLELGPPLLHDVGVVVHELRRDEVSQPLGSQTEADETVRIHGEIFQHRSWRSHGRPTQ